MRVAIVHDWLYVVGGAERVLGELLAIYPDADVFTLFDFLDEADRAKLGYGRARTSFLQSIPFMRSKHQAFLPLMPIAVEQFDLSAYDLVISNSYAVAKGVLTGPDQVHVSYVQSPMRYAWDMQHSYLRDAGYEHGIKGVIARLVLHRMRIWDSRTGNGPDAIVANSAFIARRIRKVYGRASTVIHPPVQLSDMGAAPPRGSHFLVASRLVSYKNVRAVVEAFNAMPNLELTVAGTGPEAERIRQIAGPNIAFTGFVSDAELRRLMATARAFVFSALEDFGIIPLEAQAEGTPVLALGRGGSLETVVAAGRDRTGMFFKNPDPVEIAACVRAFIDQEDQFSRAACRQQAARFSAERFRAEFADFVDEQMAKHRGVDVDHRRPVLRLKAYS